MSHKRLDSGLIVLGDDEIRIEEGPVLVTAIATADLLDNSQTHDDYQLGGPDAYGYPIEEGQEFQYLDRGGSQNDGTKCFYIYGKYEVDPSADTLPNGSPNPYYVPEENREPEDGKSRTHYTYIFAELGTRKTEEAAIEFAETQLTKLRSLKDRKQLPPSHLERVAYAGASPRLNFAKRIAAAREARSAAND